MKGFWEGIAILVLGLGVGMASLCAQDKSTYYTVRHPHEFSIDWTGFYDKIDALTEQTRRELPHYLDLAYGRHPKQKLDIYLPPDRPSKAPVFLFLHGGGFREGDRAHYGFIARPFARHGIVTVVASYRLTSQGFHYPDQPRDVQDALTWLYRNVNSYGGDPQYLMVGGHSAGAILAAYVSVKTQWIHERGLPADLIKGCIPVSGPYDLRPGAYEERQGEADAYVNRAELREAASPIANLQSTPRWTLVALGSEEPKYLESSRAFVQALQKRGAKAELLVLEGQDHADTALSLGDENSLLFRSILRLIQSP